MGSNKVAASCWFADGPGSKGTAIGIQEVLAVVFPVSSANERFCGSLVGFCVSFFVVSFLSTEAALMLRLVSGAIGAEESCFTPTEAGGTVENCDVDIVMLLCSV